MQVQLLPPAATPTSSNQQDSPFERERSRLLLSGARPFLHPFPRTGSQIALTDEERLAERASRGTGDDREQ
jgi:hypothetical protein